MGRNTTALCTTLSRLLAIASIFFAMQNFSVAADIIEIADKGGQPIEKVMKDIFGTGEDPSGTEPVKDIDNVSAIGKFLQFPFKPSKASPGLHVSKDFEHPLQYAPPIVLIGSDDISKRWLKKNKLKLREISATLIVIEASSEHDIRQLSSEYEGKIMPMSSSDDLLTSYQIDHYPVLITQDGVYQ
ncbi:PFL_4695 family integrating conjugative element protein [Shewanella glacialipiscicola]|uniref:PFL_4695 family integrating conjugative element protein n=1 Tax=Shewanella glacialipiscicola TaxID=614069 RepID=UPI003D7B39D9